jgi:Tol biopolymer transport system component
VIRRLAGVVVVASALLALPVVAQAEVPLGPRLTFTRAGDAGSELITADPAGQDQRVIAGGGEDVRPLPLALSSLSWPGDGSAVVFAGLSGNPRDARFDLYLVGADGSGLRRIPGTRDGLDPVLSPDARTLAFVRIHRRQPTGRKPHVSLSTWLVDLTTGAVSRLGPAARPEIPSSFSPDGATLAVTRPVGDHGSDAVAIDLATGHDSVLARNAADPVYSPDGSKIAFLRGPWHTFRDKGRTTVERLTDMYAVNVDGSGLTRLTKTPRQIELAPSWDPSGQRLAYTEFKAGLDEADFLGIGDSIMEINADGSCRTKVLSVPNVTLYGATWQPGPGREAGSISC